MMKMSKRYFAAAAVMVMSAGLPVSAQESKTGQPSGARPTTPDTRDASDFKTPSWQKDERGTGMAMEQPGEMQRWLRKFDGTWRVEVKETGMGMGHGDANRETVYRDHADREVNDKDDMHRDDKKRERNKSAAGKNSSDVVTSTATAKTEFKHDRHSCTKVEGTCHGQPFEGMGVMGYNNAAKRFESVWHDNVHTGIGYMTGQLDSTGKVLTMSGECSDPSTGQTMNKRSVTRWVSDDQYVTEIFGSDSASGAEKCMAVMTFTREGSAVSTKNTAKPVNAAPDDRHRNADGTSIRDNPR